LPGKKSCDACSRNDSAPKWRANHVVHPHLPMATASGFASFDGVLHRLLTEKRALASSILHPVGQMDLKVDLIRMVCG